MAGLGGRRTLRTPERREQVLRMLRTGSTREDAARAAGMDPSTLRRWMHADARLRRELDEAEGTCRVRMVATIVDAAWGRPAQYDDAGNQIRAEVRPNAVHAEWYMERRDPLNWGRRLTIDIKQAIRAYAEREGFDYEEVVAEVEKLMDEHATLMRRN